VKEETVENILHAWGKEYKKGFMGYFVLLFLKERPMYGFELSRKFSEISDGTILFQESGIYQFLKKMSRCGVVLGEWKESERGPRRRYYKLQDSGYLLLDEFTRRYILPILRTAGRLVETHYPEQNT